MKSRGHIAAALILGITAIQTATATVATGYETVPAVTPRDEVMIRPALDNSPSEPVLAAMPVPTPTSQPLTRNPSSDRLRAASVWGIILAGLSGIAFFLWRNQRQEKTQSRWRKRHSKWRLF